LRTVTVFGIVALASSLLLAAQDLPDGPGKAIIASKCAGCHAIDTAISQRLDRDGWASVITRMVERGADVSDEEQETAADYLAAHFGPTPAPTKSDPDADRTARRYVDGICSSCHGSDVIAGTRGTRAEWVEIVKKMNGKGAGLSDADVELLGDYLAKTYPPESR
jgi:mono/diheme cytochrome c family protein